MSDTVQLSDQFLFQSSLRPDPTVKVSKGKNVVYVVDGNQGSYNSGLITIDSTNQLNGSQGFASLREGYICLPYVVTAKNTGATALAAPLTRFASSLKCNVANVIDSLSVELNGKKIISELEYKNFWNNLRAQTETAQATIVKHAADRQLYPDDWRSINFSSASSSCGDGYANNQIGAISTIDSTLGQTQEQFNMNNGFFQHDCRL
ncbi:hypothetical protein FI667_g13418, partial [Globisporangium splendens]